MRAPDIEAHDELLPTLRARVLDADKNQEIIIRCYDCGRGRGGRSGRGGRGALFHCYVIVEIIVWLRHERKKREQMHSTDRIQPSRDEQPPLVI